MKYSIQKVKYLEGGQQKNTDEDDLLKFQMQNLEDVAKINEDDVLNTFDEDTNEE